MFLLLEFQLETVRFPTASLNRNSTLIDPQWYLPFYRRQEIDIAHCTRYFCGIWRIGAWYLVKTARTYIWNKGCALNWIRSYLSGRTQFVKVDDSTSEKYPSLFGVPQGSVLGPILFALHVSPVANVIEKAGLQHHQYADDTQLYIVQINWETVIHTLDWKSGRGSSTMVHSKRSAAQSG